MTGTEFQEDSREDHEGIDRAGNGDFHLALDGYEGPIDLLLDLARTQKLDLTRISILALVDQYLAFIQKARDLRLELAADYLVMAAWLAYLKSRLLLPDPPAEGDAEPTGAEMAAALRLQLQRLEALRRAAAQLVALPQRGQELFARGELEPREETLTVRYHARLFDLLRAYGRVQGRRGGDTLHIPVWELYSVEEAMQRLTGGMARLPGWHDLLSFLPRDGGSDLRLRSALACTFLAGLELCREGRAELRQDGPFGPVLLRSKDGSGAEVPPRP